jgi:hypothetical protein
MRASTIAASLLVGLVTLGAAVPAAAQSVGFVTGFPGKDPADDDGIGWGPAYRPETSFSQPGVPPTPGDFAGAAYRARTGHGPYDAVQGPAFQRPLRPVRAYEPGYDEEPAYAPRARTARTKQIYTHRQQARTKVHRTHRQVMR